MTVRSPYRVVFCVSGGGRIARAAVEHAARIGIHPLLIVAENRASSDLEGFCRANGVALRRLARATREQLDEEVITACITSDPDLIVLTFDKIVPAPLVRAFAGRMINLHMGLLPGTAGYAPMKRTIASGATISGATVHEVTEEVDAGPIVAQCVVPLARTDTPESLGARLYPLARDMTLQVLAWYASGRVVRHPDGRLLVSDAIYGSLPVVPSLEINAII